jgi:hypothetical protein
MTWLLCCTVVHAQARVRTATTSGTQDHYEDLVRDAVREFAGGNFVEARTLFEQAHALKPSARTFRGLGSSAYELKRYTQAVHELEAALAETRNPLTDAQRSEVEGTLAKARRYVGSVVLGAEPAQAAILVDGQPVQAGKLMLDAGEHVFRASASGYRSDERNVVVLGAQEVTLTLQLEPLELSPAQVAKASATEPPSTARAVDTHGESGLLSRWWFWTVAGVVVAGAAVGTAVALSGGSQTAAADKGNGNVLLRPPP